MKPLYNYARKDVEVTAKVLDMQALIEEAQKEATSSDQLLLSIQNFLQTLVAIKPTGEPNIVDDIVADQAKKLLIKIKGHLDGGKSA